MKQLRTGHAGLQNACDVKTSTFCNIDGRGREFGVMQPNPVLLTFTGKTLSFSPTIITILDCNYSLLLNYLGTELNATLLASISFFLWIGEGTDTGHLDI